MTIEEYLWRYHGWQGKQQGNTIVGCCPIHPERRPSFSIYPHDEHWCCYHENRTGTLEGIVNILEFGDTDTPSTWHAVFERVRSLTGQRDEGKRPFIALPTRPELPYATHEQRALLTAAMHWWYEQLWTPDIAHRGRAYFRERGVSLPDLRFNVQLGYAPASWTPQEDLRLFTSFSYAMEWAVGKGWEPMAKDLGLLSKTTGHLALRDRVIFCSINELGQCVFFQSRQVQFTGKRPKYPYMSATGIRKVPFLLTIPQVTSSITHVESPFGVAILAPYGLSAMAWHGGPSKTTLGELWLQYLFKDRLQIICMDNDVPHHRHGGETYYPGDHHAQVLQDYFDEKGYASMRVIPPYTHKGLDEWVRYQGIDPFLEQVHLATAPVL